MRLKSVRRSLRAAPKRSGYVWQRTDSPQAENPRRTAIKKDELRRWKRALCDFKMILDVMQSDAPAREICQLYGYRSPAGYYRKRNALLKKGIIGLIPQKRGPKNKWRLTDDIIRRIVSIRFHNPQLNSESIADILRQNGFSISRRSVERVLTEFGISQSRRSNNYNGKCG